MKNEESEVSVLAYVKENVELLEKFYLWWLEKNRVKPDSYPLDLKVKIYGGWDDQFQLFRETQQRKKRGS